MRRFLPIELFWYRFAASTKLWYQNYELHVGSGRRPDNRKEFQRFARTWAKYYHGFVEKWIHSPVKIRRLIVDYTALTQDTVETLINVTEFLNDKRFNHRIPDAISGLDHISHRDGRPLVVKKAGVVNLRSVEDFRHYDPNLFKEITRTSIGR